MAGENAAVLSEEEKARILYHMGYGVVLIADLFTLGVPAMSQTMYIAASAVQRIGVTKIQIVRNIVAVLDGLERKMIEAQDYFVADTLDGIKINPRNVDQLDGEYTRWAKRLSDALIAPLNPYSDRFGGGSRSMNFPVRVC